MRRFNLGTHQRSITTTDETAHTYFNLGLNWCFGFNHDEAIVCFSRALEHDPNCAMAHWGIAYASGPIYNEPWRFLCPMEAEAKAAHCHHHIQRARALSAQASELERGLIEALAARHPKNHSVPIEEFDAWDTGYAVAMRDLYKRWPHDTDIAVFFAEALMMRTPWRHWDVLEGKPREVSDILEALDVLEHAIAQADQAGEPQHPGILHFHIHALEMSPKPEAALRSADVLGTLCPDAGHINHMPGHIYMLCGLYDKARAASEKAIRADDMFLEYSSGFTFYSSALCHDLHLMVFACMFLGQYNTALAAADKMIAFLDEDKLRVEGRPQLAATLEGYYSTHVHVLVRFGRWQQIIDTPMPSDPELYCVTTPMLHYAKGIAFAASGRFEEADAQAIAFHESVARVPEKRRFFNNTARRILGVAEKMMSGEIAYHKGHYDVAFADLRVSVARNDALRYSEPWPWMHPPRHALGALLAAQGHMEEAETVYRADLGLNDALYRAAQHPGNVWALHGLAECLAARGECVEGAEINAQLAVAQTKADHPITSACACRAMAMEADAPCCGGGGIS